MASNLQLKRQMLRGLSSFFQDFLCNAQLYLYLLNPKQLKC